MEELAIEYKPRPAIKVHVLVNFITEVPATREEECCRELEPLAEPERENIWRLYMDGASNDEGPSVRIRLIDLEGHEFTNANRVEFKSTNNEAKYEAFLAKEKYPTPRLQGRSFQNL